MSKHEHEIDRRISLIKAYAKLLNEEIEGLDNYCRQAKANKEGVSTSSDIKKAHLEQLGNEAIAKRAARINRKRNI